MAVVVAGEALVDLAPRDGLLAPLPGGSPYNVAIGLARQGATAHYLGRLSTDGFGELLGARLREEGVALAFVTRTDDPTTLAVVHLDDAGRASYGFYLAATSAAGLTLDDLPATLPDHAALHVSLGAVALTTEPAGAALRALIDADRRPALVCLDPNVRPVAIGDPVAYRPVLERAVAACDVVKVSDEDLEWLQPGEAPLAVARRWAQLGPALVVVTRGDAGAVAIAADGEVAVPGEPVDVVDTVGAGDAFTAGLLAWLSANDRLTRDAVATLGADELRVALLHAVHVAAVTCTRAGADPPHAHAS